MRRITREQMLELIDEELHKLTAHVMSSTYKWVTADELLEHGPGIISYVILTATQNNCDATLHDGVDANAKVIATLETTGNQSRPYAFHDDLLFREGLYLSLSGDVLGILVVWHPLPRGITKG